MPDRPSVRARLLWAAELDASVLRVTARAASTGARDILDLSVWAHLVTVAISPSGAEHIAISDGYRRIRLDVVAGTLLAGRVRLSPVFDGLDSIEPKILTLRRLLGLIRLGRFSRGLHPRERMAPRWILALRACDALRDGAHHRDFASVLFGGRGSAAEWRGASDFQRLRVQRLVRIAKAMVKGGYRALLR